MKKNQVILLLLLVFLVSGCAHPERDKAEAYAITIEADANAANAAQVREIARENQDWENLKRTEKAEYWASIENVAQVAGQFLTVILYAGLAAFAVAAFYALSAASVDMAKTTARAYGDFVTIRARLIAPDKNTGLRPQIMWQETPALPEPKNLIERFTVRHIRGGKWYLHDTQSGQGFAMDESNPADKLQLEVMRQLQLTYQIAMRQERSGKKSPDGLVAAEIGQAAITLPDAGRVLLEAARENFPVLTGDDVEAE